MKIKEIFDRLFDYYNVYSIQDLATSMNVSQSTVSQWKSRNTISAIEKKCREIGIYKEIFDDNSQEISKKSDEIESENKSDLSKYFTALQSVAIATNKEDELLTDIKKLIKKYIQ